MTFGWEAQGYDASDICICDMMDGVKKLALYARVKS